MSRHNTDFIIRTYQQGDEIKINEMFIQVFSEKRDISHWYWKYRDNPHGAHFFSLAVSHDGKLAAHYGGYPVIFCRYRPDRNIPEEFLTVHLGDKMTSRQFRGVGFGKNSLLRRTFMHFQNTCVRDTIPFVYGFTTDHSLRFGLLFLNYTDIEPVSYRKCDMSSLNSLTINTFKKLFLNITVEETEEIDQSWTDFFYRVAPRYGYLAKRDAPYLRWRYLKRPDRKYLLLKVRRGKTIHGWSVFFREGNKIIWGDALFAPGAFDCLKALLCRLREHPVSAGAEYIECWFPPRPSWWDSMLCQLGFLQEAEPSGLHFTSAVFNDPGASETLRKHFYYTLGDSDLF
jgi:hypothetical protein